MTDARDKKAKEREDKLWAMLERAQWMLDKQDQFANCNAWLEDFKALRAEMKGDV